MTAETDLIKLYSARILALTADIPHLGRLDSPQGTARRRSPLCGSTVTADLALDGEGRIAEFAQDVKACALGQASASVLGRNAIGLRVEELRRGRDELVAMLREEGPATGAPFEELEVLMPARDYRNRHASILLAFEAALEAMEEARQRDCA